MLKNISRQSINIQAGFSLIEVLISIILLAFGMLGMAGLFNYSLSANSNASNRMAASLLASDYAELVRANPDSMISANPDSMISNTYNKQIATYNSTTNISPENLPNNFCSYPSCRSSTTASVSTETLDIALFRNRVKAMLPAGDFQAARVVGTNQIDIWIVWAEGKGGDAANDTETSSDNCPVSISNQSPRPDPYPRCLFTRVAL